MYEPPEIKVAFANVYDRTYCQACLSSDRALTLIGDHIEIYHKIVDCSQTFATADNTYLCWECLAILKKIQRFKDRADNARTLLTYHLSNVETASLPTLPTLSTLTTFYKDDSLFLNHDDTEPVEELVTLKLETICDVKIETNDSDNDAHDEYNGETSQDVESIQDIKSIRKPYNRAKKYRYVYNGNVRKKGLLRKKFPIKPNEVGMWIEREMDSDYYKQMTYKCKSCWYASNCRDKYRKHTVASHKKAAGSFVCHICKCRFGTESDLNSHAPSHYTGRQCAACGIQCYSARHLNAHLDTHRTVQCISCEAHFSDVQLFREHYKSIHTLYICDYCGKRCSAKRILERHMRHHAPVHPCSICHKEYSTIIALRKHKSMKHAPATGEVAYCVLCDKQYENVYVYRRHVQDCAAHAHERSIPKKRVPCPLCENTYSRKAYMLNHYRLVHMNTSKHYCVECDKHFLNATKFKDHKKYTHEGLQKPKNKICSTCGRGFVNNRVLKNHILTHSGERPYECEVCGAKFTQKHSMVSHVKHIHLKSKRRAHWQQ